MEKRILHAIKELSIQMKSMEERVTDRITDVKQNVRRKLHLYVGLKIYKYSDYRVEKR